jgi:hypothetical protein
VRRRLTARGLAAKRFGPPPGELGAARTIERELDATVARYDDGGLTADDIQSADDVARLNTLELYRLKFVPDLPVAVRAAMATAWAALPHEVVGSA